MAVSDIRRTSAWKGLWVIRREMDQPTQGGRRWPPPDNGTIPVPGKEGAGNPEDPRESRTTNLEDTDGISGNTASTSYGP